MEENMPEVTIQAGTARISGFLEIPEGALGIVIFAHGSGSSRYSTRNQWVASYLREGGLGTLLIDLLTPEEEAIDLYTRELRFDIPFLGKRVSEVTDWVLEQPELEKFPLGYFGSSTGAAAALVAAADKGAVIRAVVSRGGRPDLAEQVLPGVVSPTLLLVGGNDGAVIGMNEFALDRLTCEKQLEIIPGATHLFEEPGTLESVAEKTRDWFVQYFS